MATPSMSVYPAVIFAWFTYHRHVPLPELIRVSWLNGDDSYVARLEVSRTPFVELPVNLSARRRSADADMGAFNDLL